MRRTPQEAAFIGPKWGPLSYKICLKLHVDDVRHRPYSDRLPVHSIPSNRSVQLVGGVAPKVVTAPRGPTADSENDQAVLIHDQNTRQQHGTWTEAILVRTIFFYYLRADVIVDRNAPSLTRCQGRG